jgi:CDP-diacylglycerol--glycerol-3-phosphate 3-phosphatidyltransferase
MVLPNQLTVARILLTPLFMVLFLSSSQVYREISLAVFLIAALTDWYDGWLARKFNYFTEWGKFMDPLADKILTSSDFVAFAIDNVLPAWMVIIILVRDFSVTIFRGIAEHKGYSFPTSLYAKWKTFLQMIFLYYLLFVYVLSANQYLHDRFSSLFSILLNSTGLLASFAVITTITAHSGIVYFYENRSILKKLLGYE